MPKISIIIPAYNQSRFLAQAVDSALQQTHADIEVVVVDDGSTDQTPQVADSYASRPNVKIIHQANTGLPGARNRGLAESTGDYVSFLDSDDYFDPDKSTRQAALLDENPDVGFVYCDIVTVDPEGQPVAEQFSIGGVNRPLSGNLFPSLMLGGYFPPHTVMVRRSVLDKVGPFDPALGGHADYELWLRVAAAGYKAVFVDAPLAIYRTHADSMSKDAQHMTETRIATFRKITRLYPDLVGDALNQLQQCNQDLHRANQWLHEQWTRILHRKPNQSEPLSDGGCSYSMIPHLAEGRQTKGQPDQVAVWDATIDGTNARAVYMQPPAELTFRVPTGASGILVTALTIHPDAWHKPEAGGCEFHIRADGRLACVVAVDPTHTPADRRWHEIRLDVPANAAGFHDITFETRSIGPITCRWALWRAPRLTWEADPATETPA